MKKLRPYRHLDDTGNELSEEKLKKHLKVNKGKIQKIKSQFKDELEYKKKLVRENQMANLQLEKDKYFGTSEKISKAERKIVKQAKKQKNAKYVLGNKRKHDNSDEASGDDSE